MRSESNLDKYGLEIEDDILVVPPSQYKAILETVGMQEVLKMGPEHEYAITNSLDSIGSLDRIAASLEKITAFLEKAEKKGLWVKTTQM